jgi:hypothetical protein
MKNAAFTLLSTFLIILFSCEKAEDPFEFPENPENPDPELITLIEREVAASENWMGDYSAEGCFGTASQDVYARYEFNAQSGNCVLRLIPDSATCNLDAEIKSVFLPDEISDYNLNALEFEFTFSQLILTSETDFWLSWYYKNLELDVNLAPYIYNALEPEQIANGVVKVSIENEYPVITVQGEEISPDLNDASIGNHFELNNSNSENYFKTSMHADNTTMQSLLVFRYLRITTFDIPQ